MLELCTIQNNDQPDSFKFQNYQFESFSIKMLPQVFTCNDE